MRWVTLAFVLASATARADPAPEKSRTLSLAVPIGVTLGGVAVGELGSSLSQDALEWTGGAMIVVGPSLGHLYVHDWFSFGLGVRAAGALVFLEPSIAGEHGDEMKFWICGATLYAIGALWEIGTGPSVVFDYNYKHAHAVSIVPTRHGVALAGTF